MRLLKRRFAELQQAVPCSIDPSSLIGASVLRRFDGYGAFSGTVVEYDPFTGFRVQYSDGDSEDLSLRELRPLLTRDTLPAHLQRMPNGMAVQASAQPSILQDVTVHQIFNHLEQRQREEQHEKLAAEEAALAVAAAAEDASRLEVGVKRKWGKAENEYLRLDTTIRSG